MYNIYIPIFTAFFVPTIETKVNEDVQHKASSRVFYKDSAVLGTLIGVCLFILIVIVVLALLTKLGFNPGTKLVQSKYIYVKRK